MSWRIFWFTLVLVTLSASYVSNAQPSNLVVNWADKFYSVIKQTRTLGPVRPGPTNVARAASILFSCMYDTWAAFTPKARPYSGTKIVHSIQNTPSNVEEALHYSAHRALTYIYGSTDPQLQTFVDTLLSSAGQVLSKVGDVSLSTPASVGISACSRIVQNRDNDGSNPKGNQPTAAQRNFADYTNYAPANDPFPEFAKTNCATLKYIDKWQPALVKNANGSLVVQVWGDVVYTNLQPFGLLHPDEFRVIAPSRNNTRTQAAWNQKWAELVDAYGQLDDLKKTIAYFWDQGTDGLSPTGLLMQLTTNATRISGRSMEESLKIHFVAAHTQLDAMISQYSNKRYWDPPRPTTPIQCIYQGKSIKSWLGPYQGVGTMDGSDWRAYTPDTVVQNSSPEYPCGHCTISGAWVGVVEKFFGTQFIGLPFTLQPGMLPLERKITDPSDPKYVRGLTDVPNTGPFSKGYAPGQPITLSWKTFDEAANQVGDARVFNGVHTYESHRIAHALGRSIAQRVFDKASHYFKGRPYRINHNLLPS